MSKSSYLTKSSYVSAHLCERWLWNDFHNRPPFEAPVPGSNADIGNKVGHLARVLFPDGVLASEPGISHQDALARTQSFMSDPNVTAIYEAAFEHEGVRIRVDVLERLDDDTWGIREVKSSSSVRRKTKYSPLEDKHALDVAVQVAVVRRAGLDVQSAQLVFVNSDYVLDGDTPDPERFFRQAEILEEIEGHVDDVSIKAHQFLEVLNVASEPDIEPAKSRCNKLGNRMCPFWERCTAQMPEDWVDALYNARGNLLPDLKERGIARLSELNVDETRNKEQARMVHVAQSGKPLVETGLAASLSEISLPAIHLDFEYLSGVALPVHIGTTPHQRVPFQFSAHRLNTDMTFDHVAEYLAEGNEDPSREFAEHLIDLLKGGEEPIVAYSARNAEIPVLKDLIARFEDLTEDLTAIKDRIVDIKTVVQNHVMLPVMITKAVKTGGSLYTLKSIAPAFVPDFTYDDLGVVSHGGAAVEAYFQMVTGERPDGVSREELRASMLAYCKKDTEATVVVHAALARLETA